MPHTKQNVVVPFDVNDALLRDEFLAGAVLDALDSLAADTPPRWGRMSAQQMVEHLAWAFELSTGRGAVECAGTAEEQVRYKKFLYSNRPSPPEFMNPALADGLPPLRHADLAHAIAALRREMERFNEHLRAAPSERYMHPIFGLIGMDEWSRTHFKHCYHHLVQFGLLEYPSFETT
jgi:oxepin-CoA hydrolase/3-oxo-5,6-dehydrosuberyl-CoA semialdehyde dehydrogenase